MVKNKNARLRIIDGLLSRGWISAKELKNRVDAELNGEDNGADCKDVNIRTIQTDIAKLEGPPYNAPIERSGNSRVGIVYRYKDASFSIFNRVLNEDERTLMQGLLDTMARMDGIEGLDWMKQIRALVKGNGENPQRGVISFSSNPGLRNLDYLSRVFMSIVNRCGVRMVYHAYGKNAREVVVYPYLLKQYSDRWFLVAKERGYVGLGVYALDRIDSYVEDSSVGYVECDKAKLQQRFDNIIGVTDPPNEKVEDIVCWVADKIVPYVETKPLHMSQQFLKGRVAADLRMKYATLGEGRFITIRCKYNHELEHSLMHYGEGIIVVEPQSVRMKLMKLITGMCGQYAKVEKLND